MLQHSKRPPAYYSYSADTGEYTGTGLCDFSPARHPRGHEQQGQLIEPNEPIVPGCATLVEPPHAPKGKVAVWDDQWTLVPDYRGEVRYGRGEFLVVTGIGDPPLPPIKVHGAEHLPDGRIRMWVNDDEIEFDDTAETLPRKVLAAWEAEGGVIRTVDKAAQAGVEGSPVPQEEHTDA